MATKTCKWCSNEIDECNCPTCDTCDKNENSCKCPKCNDCANLLDDCDCEKCDSCDEKIHASKLKERCKCERCEQCEELIEDCKQYANCDRCSECGLLPHAEKLKSRCKCKRCPSCEELEQECIDGPNCDRCEDCKKLIDDYGSPKETCKCKRCSNCNELEQACIDGPICERCPACDKITDTYCEDHCECEHCEYCDLLSEVECECGSCNQCQNKCECEICEHCKENKSYDYCNCCDNCNKNADDCDCCEGCVQNDANPVKLKNKDPFCKDCNVCKDHCSCEEFVPDKVEEKITKKASGIMASPTVQRAKTAIKKETVDAAYRVAVKNITKVIKQPLIATLKSKGAEQPVVDAIAQFLDTELGGAMVQYLLGIGISSIPNLSENEKAKRIAEECRISGMANAADVGVQFGMEHFSPIVSALIEHINGQPEVVEGEKSEKIEVPALFRIAAAPKEEVKEEVEEEVEEVEVAKSSKKAAAKKLNAST